MTTPTVVDALAGAIDMLNNISRGRQYSAAEFHERVRSYEDALNDARIAEMQAQRNRAAIRAMSEQRRQG